MDRPSKKASKSKRKPKPCPNPLFIQWLERWRDEARSKESKMQYVFSKAITSLKKYPLPLESGKEATLLDGVGPAIAKLLDEELAKHKKNSSINNGIPVVVDLGGHILGEGNFSDLRVPPPPKMMIPTTSSFGSSSDDTQPPKPKKKRKSSPREYIPMYRSGPYAILIVLHQASQRVGSKGYMTKAELMGQAQPFADASFIVPDPDSYYTAWSSMSTLIKKGFIVKAGNPARFFLSDSGHVLANKLLTAKHNYNATPTSPNYAQVSPSLSISTVTTLPSFSVKEINNSSKKKATKKKQTMPRATLTLHATSTSPATSTSHAIVTLPVTSPATTQPRTFPKSKRKLSAASFIDVSASSYPDKSKGFLSSYKTRILGTDVKMHQSGSLHYWFVDSDGQCVENENQAAVIIDDDISLGFLIKCKLCDLEKTSMKYKLDHSKTNDNGYVFVFMASECLTNNNVENNSTKKKQRVKSNTSGNNTSDDSDDDILMRPLFQRLTKDSDVVITGISNEGNNKVSASISKKDNNTSVAKTSMKDNAPISKKDYISIDTISKNVATVSTKYSPPVGTISKKYSDAPVSIIPKKYSAPVATTSKKDNTPIVDIFRNNNAPIATISTKCNAPISIISKNNNVATATTSKKSVPPVVELESINTEFQLNQPSKTASSREATKILSNVPSNEVVPLFELKPDSYDIILCVDFIEITGGSKTVRKDEMVKELRLNGVQFDVRKLNVGDFLWVAREKTTPLPGQLVLPERRELVLNYIVERKRMDDLCSSIKDGRFKEQKFRLLNSGLRNPVYLVEDFGSISFLSMPAQTLDQAIINTQIGQDFFIKRTRDIKESAAYLTIMTRYLQNLYHNKTLKAIKKDDMEFINEDEDQAKSFLMTFYELNDISLKNRVLTVGELFGKQLLQIPGIAVEKAVRILESYPTLKHILDAYEEQTTEKEREDLLSGLKYGKTQRKIGPTASKMVYHLYCTKGSLL